MKELDSCTTFDWQCGNVQYGDHQERFASGQLVLVALTSATVACRITADSSLGNYQMIDLVQGDVRVLVLPMGTREVRCVAERGRVAVSLEGDVQHDDREGGHTYKSLQHVSV